MQRARGSVREDLFWLGWHPTLGKGNGHGSAVATGVILLIVVIGFLGWQGRAEAYTKFPAYREELVQKGLAVVDIQNDAYPAMFQVENAAGADLVVSRSTDALVFKVPDDGKVVLKTASVAWLWGVEDYVLFPIQLKVGDFIGPRGGKMGPHLARDFYVDNLREPALVTKFFQDLFSRITKPEPWEENW